MYWVPGRHLVKAGSGGRWAVTRKGKRHPARRGHQDGGSRAGRERLAGSATGGLTTDLRAPSAGKTAEIPTRTDFLFGGPAARALGAGQGAAPCQVGGASWALREQRSGRRGTAPWRTACLGEGFLVKRVSAPEPLRHGVAVRGGCRLT